MEMDLVLIREDHTMRRAVTSLVALVFAGFLITSVYGVFRDGIQNVDNSMDQGAQQASILAY